MTKSDKKEEIKTNVNQEEDLHENTKPAEVEETVEEKLEKSEEKLLRTLAEMENQRRRFEKERKDAFEFGGFNFAKETLALLDNIDRAAESFKNDENLKDNKDLNKIIDSIEIIKKDLISIFKKNGIEPINCLNRKFDPNFHQAMLEIEDDTKEAGMVVQEIQKGYMMNERLLRHSLVGVTKKRDKKQEKSTKNNEKEL